MKRLSWIHWLGIAVLVPCALVWAYVTAMEITHTSPIPVMERRVERGALVLRMLEPVTPRQLDDVLKQERKGELTVRVFTYDVDATPGKDRPAARYEWTLVGGWKRDY